MLSQGRLTTNTKAKHVGIVENVTNFIFSEALKW